MKKKGLTQDKSYICYNYLYESIKKQFFMKIIFLFAKAAFIVLFIIFSLAGISQNIQKPGESKPITGNNLNAGKAGVPFKIGTKPIEIYYESTGLMSDFPIALQKVNKLSVSGSTWMSGLLSSNPETKEKKANTIPVSESHGKDNPTFNLTGEPVPGAEIFVELESDKAQKKIPVHSTNPVLRKTPLAAGQANPGKVSISVKLKETCFPYYVQNGKRMISSGIYVFCLETVVNKVKNLNEFVVVIHEPVMSYPKDDMSGPFSQSLSNIEDNGKLVYPKELEIEAKVFLVNSFTDFKRQ